MVLPYTMPYSVVYDDGDEEHLDLGREHWRPDDKDLKPLPPALLEGLPGLGPQVRVLG